MSSLALEVNCSEKRRLVLPVAVSIPLEFVPPTKEKSEVFHGSGLVDTGAELSLVCEQLLGKLEALPSGSARIVGIRGEPRDVDTYLVDLHFIYQEQLSWAVKRLEVGPLENSANVKVLIGMDVLTMHAEEFTLCGRKAIIKF